MIHPLQVPFIPRLYPESNGVGMGRMGEALCLAIFLGGSGEWVFGVGSAFTEKGRVVDAEKPVFFLLPGTC